MPLDNPPDLGFWEWAWGLLAAGFGAALAHLHLRINRVEDTDAVRHREARNESKEDGSKIWAELSELRRQTVDFQGETLRSMFTKEDARDFEKRLVERLSPRRGA